jgi:uncharacterized protein YybS (DUF2232 family)
MSDVQSRTHLAAWSLRIYSPHVATTQEPRSGRVLAERAARIALIAGLAPVIPCVALIIWQLGFAAHPHHVAFACIVAIIFAVVVVAVRLLNYRLRIKRATKRGRDR